MSASFYASPTVGATTTMAVFFHEIPHEVGDFALLVQSGFSKRAAMASQFVTAVGALLGTLIGIAVQELGGGGDSGSEARMARNGGLWGTSLVSTSFRGRGCRRRGTRLTSGHATAHRVGATCCCPSRRVRFCTWARWR